MSYDLNRIGEEILMAVRNELYMNFPYMDTALCALSFVPGEEQKITTMASDGDALYYSGRWIADRYVRSRTGMNRGYMHVIFHCILRHIGKAAGKDPVLWDIACDTAVEALLQDLPYDCIADRDRMPVRQNFIAECSGEMKVVTAEGVYRKLQREERDRLQLGTLDAAFRVDDHRLWIPQNERQRQQREQQEQKWDNMARRTMSLMKTMFRENMGKGREVMDRLEVAVRDDVDYRSFLRRFAAPREVMETDPDAFDYIYYTYGLELYGNMPLVEPLETREEKRIEDLVIAVDTSMSTSGETVRMFLACTYAILRSTETFTRKVNIHILQCDNKVRADDEIRDLDELREYMSRFRLKGGDTTDFRPVFEYVDELIAAGEFTSLRGLIYFTDGLGFYPKSRPAYETAFVFLGQPPASIPVPPWAIRLVLEIPDLQRTLESVEEEEPELTDWDELPRT